MRPRRGGGSRHSSTRPIVVLLLGLGIFYLTVVYHMQATPPPPPPPRLQAATLAANRAVAAAATTATTPPPVRIYCMIPTVYARFNIGLMKAVLDTWGPQCDVLRFFIDPGEGIPAQICGMHGAQPACAPLHQVDMVRKNGDSVCGDGSPCRHIWEKVWRSWVWIGRHDIDKADYFCKIDDDSFFVPANLRKYVTEQRWSADDPHYFGHRFMREDGDAIISGVLTAFSRETVRRLLPLYENMPREYGPRSQFKSGRCVDREGATEERTAALCLKSIGILPEPAYDSRLRERVLPLGLPFTITYPRKANTTGWYWHHKVPETPDRERCCAPDMWGTHGYKGANRMRRMMNRLYTDNLGDLRARIGLPRSAPATWEAQEQQLYDLAALSGGASPLPPAKTARDVRPNHSDRFWHDWWICMMRMSFLHNPYVNQSYVHPDLRSNDDD